MKQINEKELHELFAKLKQDKTENIFNELYTKYRKLVYRIAFCIVKNNENSDDITQIVFSKIWSMDTSNLPKTGETSWLYSITKNETLNYLKKKRDTFDLEDIYYIADEDINKLLDYDSYNRIISKLNKKEQEIVSLKILSDLSFKEIAQVLNEPVGTIKWRYYKSIHTLKILLGNLGMFLITFIIGLKATWRRNEKNEEQVTDNLKNEQNIPKDEDNKKENASANKILQDNVTNEEIKEEVIILQESETNINYYGIGILGISSVFLIATIIFTVFFTKYQLNRKKKLSK